MSVKPNEPGGRPIPETAVVVSYIPLLTGESGRITSADDPGIMELLRQVDNCPSGHVEGCLWLPSRTSRTRKLDMMPVFMMDQAHAVADHLCEWAEGKLGEWFSLCLTERMGRYLAVLFPDINRSMIRFKFAPVASYQEIVTAKDCQVLFRPLCFVSVTGHGFDLDLKGRIPDSSEIGFVDTRDVDPIEPFVEGKAIKTIGPFPVCWDCRPFGVDIGGFVDEQIASRNASDHRRPSSWRKKPLYGKWHSQGECRSVASALSSAAAPLSAALVPPDLSCTFRLWSTGRDLPQPLIPFRGPGFRGLRLLDFLPLLHLRRVPRIDETQVTANRSTGMALVVT
jgi:hypothetical protein